MITQKILSYCEFTNDSVYILLLLARKKENPNQVESQKESRATRFLIRSEQDIEFAVGESKRKAALYPEVVYRLYLSVSRRNLLKGMMEFQKKLIHLQYGLINGNEEAYSAVARFGSEWKSTLANKSCRDQRRFLFDIDLEPNAENEQLVVQLRSEIPVKEHFFGYTNSGMVLVTDPFDVSKVTLPPDTEIKTDSYLYIAMLNKKEDQ